MDGRFMYPSRKGAVKSDVANVESAIFAARILLVQTSCVAAPPSSALPAGPKEKKRLPQSSIYASETIHTTPCLTEVKLCLLSDRTDQFV